MAEGGGRVSVGVLVKESVSTGGPGYGSRPVPVAVGRVLSLARGAAREGVSVLVSSVLVLDGLAEGEGVGVLVLKELRLNGLAVGGRGDLPKLLVDKIHPIPRIETTLIAIGIKRERSKEGRGCIADKVLPPFYPHFSQPGQS